MLFKLAPLRRYREANRILNRLFQHAMIVVPGTRRKIDEAVTSILRGLLRSLFLQSTIDLFARYYEVSIRTDSHVLSLVRMHFYILFIPLNFYPSRLLYNIIQSTIGTNLQDWQLGSRVDFPRSRTSLLVVSTEVLIVPGCANFQRDRGDGWLKV